MGTELSGTIFPDSGVSAASVRLDLLAFGFRERQFHRRLARVVRRRSTTIPIFRPPPLFRNSARLGSRPFFLFRNVIRSPRAESLGPYVHMDTVVARGPWVIPAPDSRFRSVLPGLRFGKSARSHLSGPRTSFSASALFARRAGWFSQTSYAC